MDSIKNLNSKKFALVLILFFLMFAFSGCVKKEEVGEVFIGGTEGIKAEFVDLPTKTYPNIPFNIGLKLENKGETEVKEGEIFIILNNPTAFNIGVDTLKKNKRDLPAATLKGKGTVIYTEPEFIFWDNASVSMPGITSEQKIPLSVTITYPYKTKMLVMACATDSDKYCAPEGAQKVSNSGAPVQITSFKQQVIPFPNGGVRLIFLITVENKGNGFIEQITISNATFAGKPIELKECDIVLGATTRCYFDVTKETYDQLYLELDYNYTQTISTEISVMPD
ncbi:MAG: hypothetical protein QXQ79_01935 [Candidatus Nanoarchaeia archaeon]